MQTASASPFARSPTAVVATQAHEFLAFRLGDADYAVDIRMVQEIRSYQEPTRIASAPLFVKGVIDLRGAIVPIVDLRLRLGCASADYGDLTVVVVLKVNARPLGVVVDAVSDVLTLPPEAIRPAPEMAGAIDARFIGGIGRVDDRTLIVLDIEGLLASGSLGLAPTRAD